MPYSHAVRRLLLSHESKSWLEQDVDIFFNPVDLMGEVERDQVRRAAVEHRYFERNEREDEEEEPDDQEPDDTPWQSSISWRQIRPFLFDKLFPALATVVCILNITAALGYVLLMNDPAPPNPSFITSYVASSLQSHTQD